MPHEISLGFDVLPHLHVKHGEYCCLLQQYCYSSLSLCLSVSLCLCLHLSLSVSICLCVSLYLCVAPLDTKVSLGVINLD